MYDRNSNISSVEDHVYLDNGLDVLYTLDNLNRLVKAEEGTLDSSGSITTATRRQAWQDTAPSNMLDQLGNWEHVRLDLNADNDYIDANESNDDRTHNLANELIGRDTDDNGFDNFTLAYDKIGNLVADGTDRFYIYDAFGRLRKVEAYSEPTNILVAEFRYNGLGQRIGNWHDNNLDGKVDHKDLWYSFAYDAPAPGGWRHVATFRGSDTLPKEQFIYHNAGEGGFGGSSELDAVILRDKDASTGWTSVTDGLDERRYYCQTGRNDVVALVSDTGAIVERSRYLSNGLPFGSPKGDTNFDGTVNSTDTTNASNWDATEDVRA
jgi:hypothetical protein